MFSICSLPDDVGKYMMNRTVTAFEKMIVLAEEYLENKILFDDFIEPFEDEFAATLDVPKLDFFYLDDYNTVSLDRNPIETYYDYYIKRLLANLTC